jgi:RND family efflux transporter MFP subunit
MNKLQKRLLPLLIIVAAIAIAWLILHNRPQVKRQTPQQTATLAVETMTLQARDYRVIVDSYGKIEPHTSGELKAQVSGQIVYVSKHFRAGGYFARDETLLKIDNRDFEAQVHIAEAGLADAHQLLSEEQARSQQALDDWRRLGKSDEPSALVLRKPQLQAAEAAVASAEAQLTEARLDLSRTAIRAPYAGRILAIHADYGQVISTGTVLAEIFAVDALEVRLPLRNQDLQFVDLPESYRVDSPDPVSHPTVMLQSNLPGSSRWSGRLIRTESAIDQTSQQLHVVARIDDPYGPKAVGRQPLKIGEYVDARITGKLLHGALVIPNRTIHQGSYVYVVVDGLLQRRDITIAWHNNDDALISGGLQAGDRVVLTALGQVPSGTPVKLVDNDDRNSTNTQE